MLTDLSIRNVVLIESLDLDLEPGLTALTGETGAGKSIILDALGMATGARSDRGLIRKGSDKAQCSASFFLPKDHAVWTRLSDAGLEANSDGQLVLRRVISADGRSKAYLNDAPVGVKLMSEIGALLLEVHGQHDGRGLLDPSQHTLLLDQFGGHATDVSSVSQAFAQVKLLRHQVETLEDRAQKSADDRDFLIHAIEELDRLDPKPDEETSLSETRRFLQGAESALTELSAASQVLGEDGAFEDRLARALSGIERVQEKMGEGESGPHRALKSAAEALEKAMLEVQESRQAVADATYAFDVDTSELDQIERRLFALKAVARKHGVSLAELTEKRREFAEDLTRLDNVDQELKQARVDLAKAQDAYDKLADKLTAKREKAGKTLKKAVEAELPPLKMERASFSVQIEPAPDGAMGRDKIRFLVSTNPGTPVGPIDKIASGGELARFALAIKVALAGSSGMVMVFDEVDQGVGGAVASAVGKRLARLSETSQVFVVTHSPQVAACAAQQFQIEKSSSGNTTTTHVRAISADDREEEIARMLAGETITQEARAAARQLMKAS